MRHLVIGAVAALMVLCTTTGVSAQEYATDRGAITLGGSASFISAGGDLHAWSGDRRNTFTMNPYMLYFVSPGLGVGGDLLFIRTTRGQDSESTTLGVGPTVAYFFGGPQATVRPYLTGNVNYRSMGFGDSDVRGLGAGGGVGAAFMITPTVSITVEGVYTYERLSAEGINEDVDGNTFGVQAGVAAFIF